MATRRRTRLEEPIEAKDTDTRGELVCKFIEKYLIVPDGNLIGRPMRLLPFQRRFILDVYDNPHGTSTAYLSIARKNGKSSLIAAIMLAHLIGPEAIRNTQIISGARSRDQAAIVFSLASKMVRMNPELVRITSIVPSLKKIIGLTRSTEYHAISAEGKTAYGLSPVVAILDEVGQVLGPQDDFVDAVTSAQGAHDNPLLFAISTQAANDADLFSVWIDDAKESKDKHIVCHVHEAGVDCELDDEDAWKLANPALGVFRSRADMKKLAGKAVRMPSAEPKFRNLNLNQRVEVFSPFISKSTWQANAGKINLELFKTGKVYGGLDLSGKNDLTSAVFTTQDEDGKWHLYPIFWTPEKGLKERAKESRTPLDTWAKKGLIRIVPGASIDYEYIAKDLEDIIADWDLQACAFDRWRFDLLKKELDEINLQDVPLTKFGQGFMDMSPALESFETLLLNEQVLHGGHPVLTMCAMNSRVEMDAAGNRKLSKAKAVGRIDGMVAAAMAIGVSGAAPEPEKEYQSMFF